VDAVVLRLKEAIRRLGSDTTQRRLRSVYVAARVVLGLGAREPELAALPCLIRPGDRVVDVGANVGIYTKALARLVGRSGRVYSFEPIAENYDILQMVVRVGRLRNVETFRLALAAGPGRGEMVIPDARGFGGYYRAHLATRRGEGRRESVDVQTIDDLWRTGTLTGVDLVKCDVEGAEAEVLAGGLTLFSTQRPTSLVELDQRTSGQAFAFFAELGYRAFVFDGRFVPVDAYRGGSYRKYIFVHPCRAVGMGEIGG
jgi:FkbM family methyltransferase